MSTNQDTSYYEQGMVYVYILHAHTYIYTYACMCCKNQHVSVIMCCVHSNDKIIVFCVRLHEIMKIDLIIQLVGYPRENQWKFEFYVLE